MEAMGLGPRLWPVREVDTRWTRGHLTDLHKTNVVLRYTNLPISLDPHIFHMNRNPWGLIRRGIRVSAASGALEHDPILSRIFDLNTLIRRYYTVTLVNGGLNFVWSLSGASAWPDIPVSPRRGTPSLAGEWGALVTNTTARVSHPHPLPAARRPGAATVPEPLELNCD